MHGEPEPTDAVEIAAAWTRRLFQGRVQELDWLSTRSLTLDLRGDRSEQAPLSRGGILVLSRVLQSAFPRPSWNVNRVEQREHQILADARLVVEHEGTLDLSPFDGPVIPATGKTVKLPRQRVEWDILHGRVHHVRVVDGPGLGLDLIARHLGQEAESSLEGEAVLPACRELDSVFKDLVEPLPSMSPFPVEADHRASAPVASNGNGHEDVAGHANGNGSGNGQAPRNGASSLRDRIDEMLDAEDA